MPTPAAYPVRTLREHATALEAALSVCLAEPDKRAVHKLRTETRRIEAQLELLKLVRGLPGFRPAAAKLLRNSKKLRRAAGEVRDYDVRHRLIKEEAEKITRGADDPAAVQKRFDELTEVCEHERAQLAQNLTAVLKKRQAKTAASLEKLMDALKAAEQRRLSPTEMRALVDRAFRSTRELRLKSPNEDELHTIRKAAKRARYQLETAPNSAVARRAAKDYEALQDSGGQWHDWLELAKLSSNHFGQHHRVTLAFVAERDRHLRAYENLLAETRKTFAKKIARPARPSATAPAVKTKTVAKKPVTAKQPASKTVAPRGEAAHSRTVPAKRKPTA